MQFLPGTFDAWAVDHDGDGVANPHDIDDAVATAANYLCGSRNGAITDERAALRRYNNDGSYVTRVLDYADQIESGDEVAIVCPVAGPTTFTNTWLAPRSGGRQHKGVDIFADEGTPVVAPVAGDVEMAEDALGGLSFHLLGDDRNYYYGTHLIGYAGTSRRVTAGEVVGYVGHTGNAAHTAPHLHSRSIRTDRAATVRTPSTRPHQPQRLAPADSPRGHPSTLSDGAAHRCLRPSYDAGRVPGGRRLDQRVRRSQAPRSLAAHCPP